MARKNKNVRQRRSRRQYADTILPARTKHNEIPRVSVEDLIMPDGHCTSFQHPSRKPKASFATEEKAKKALRQAQLQRQRQGSTYMEKRYYACPAGGCGGYHLTSREEYTDRRNP